MKRPIDIHLLLNQDIHCYGTHFAVIEAKYKLIDFLASKYPRPLLQQESFQTLQILAQLHTLSLKWKLRTPRQREQQKLASQLRAITGMIGLASHLRYNGNGMVFANLDRAISDMRQVEANLRHLLKNIKERIPA